MRGRVSATSAPSWSGPPVSHDAAPPRPAHRRPAARIQEVEIDLDLSWWRKGRSGRRTVAETDRGCGFVQDVGLGVVAAGTVPAGEPESALSGGSRVERMSRAPGFLGVEGIGLDGGATVIEASAGLGCFARSLSGVLQSAWRGPWRGAPFHNAGQNCPRSRGAWRDRIPRVGRGVDFERLSDTRRPRNIFAQA